MDIVSLKSNAFKLQLKSFKLLDLFDNIKAIVQSFIVGIDVCFNIDYESMPTKILGDMARIQTLMMRLIKNSLDRTNLVRKVGVACRVENEILVKDR